MKDFLGESFWLKILFLVECTKPDSLPAVSTGSLHGQSPLDRNQLRTITALRYSEKVSGKSIKKTRHTTHHNGAQGSY